MSILVHPDKNRDDAERAQKAFEAVNKAYKTLSNEEGFKRCQEIVEEAKVKTEEMVCKVFWSCVMNFCFAVIAHLEELSYLL